MNHVARLSVLSTAVVLAACSRSGPEEPIVRQVELTTRSIARVVADGMEFRDLDRDGALDPYEDWRLPPTNRAADLLTRLSLAEKAGLMMHGSAPGGGPTAPGAAAYNVEAVEAMLKEQGVLTFITRLSIAPRLLAEENNKLQEMAEEGRWGIPITISSDPRNHFTSLEGASVDASGFSRWPGPLGLASIGDAALMRQFADTVRQEYRAVGIHVALSPQADLATEPRWPRNDGTFGEDPALAATMVREYVLGMQGVKLGPESVATVVKHWIGYPASPDGYDGHNYYGRDSILSAAELADHIQPFAAAFAAGAAGVMPTYSILTTLEIDGKRIEPVAAGYSTELLTGLLRGQHGFGGLILSDWGITNDCDQSCVTGTPPQTARSIATNWGVEALSKPERFAKGVNAGLDQFGGTAEAQHLVAAVEAGLATEERIDASVLRILEQKFALGLFEKPFVDPVRAAEVVGAAPANAAALEAQHRSLVLLENEDLILPIAAGKRVFVQGIDPAVATARGFSVVELEQAELALIRVATPFETLHPGYFFGSRHHEGRLDFRPGDAGHDLVDRTSRRVPTVVIVHLDRPAILTGLKEKANAILGEFGVSDAALFDVLMGKAPTGKLPFALPASMDDVTAQSPAVPHDLKHPLYPFGFGTTYPQP